MVPDRKPGSYWSIDPALVIAAFICVAAIFYVGWDYIALETAQHVSERYDRDTDASPTDREISELCASRPESERVHCAIDEMKSREEWDEDRRDLNAQEGMEFWAKWMFMAAFAGTVVAGYSLVLLRRTWVEATRTADIAREIGQAQVRAYLSVKRVAIGIDPHCIFRAGVVVQNSGQSPARDVHVVYEVRYRADSLDGKEAMACKYTHPWPLGEIQSGANSIEQPCVSFNIIPIPKDLFGHTVLLQVRIGVFAADVFGKEVFCIEPIVAIVEQTLDIPYIETWLRPPADFFGQDELRSHAWGHDYAARKPKDRA